LLLCISLLSSGCGVFIVGGAATAASVAHDRRTAGTVLEDQAIELKTYQALRNTPERLANAHINVTSYDRVVLLTGEVPSGAVSHWAEGVARDIDNVIMVHNELAERPPSSLGSRSNDAWLTARAKSALLQVKIPGFDPTRVKVVTQRGIVYLMGIVTEAEGEAAADSIRRVNGVQRVVKLFRYIESSG
jgi:osmotically-inducible protein OsmY